MTKNNAGDDLNQTIVAAVQARIETSVAEALLTDEAFAPFVTAALTQEVDRPGSYGRNKVTYLRLIMERSIEEQTKKVVAEEIEGQKEKIRDEVRKALRKSVGVLADSLVDGFVDSAQGRHPSVRVTFGEE